MSEGDTILTTRLVSTSRAWPDGGSIKVLPVVSFAYGPVVFFVLGGDKVSKPQVERAFADHLYVPIHEVVMRASNVILLICVLSLVTTFATNFNLIRPLFALLFAVAAVGFYLMGRMFEVFRTRP